MQRQDAEQRPNPTPAPAPTPCTQSRERERERERERLSLSIANVEHAMYGLQRTIHKKRSALKPDAFQRIPAAMPPSLRKAYEQGKWRHKEIYLWDVVLDAAQQGHKLAKGAQSVLNRVSHPSVRHHVRAENSQAVADAVQAKEKHGEQIRAILMERNQKRLNERRLLTKQYMDKREIWNDLREKREREMTEEERQMRKERDESLLLSMRAMRPAHGSGALDSMSEAEQMFSEIEQAGGTAGGLERWSRSITTIPDQNPNTLPPGCDGGGVLIEDPLRDHYLARYVNPWTQQEKLLFLDKFATYGKNFRKIASFFEYKDVMDVVRFYYNYKLPFKLKLLGKEVGTKRRSVKKNTLIELSKLPTESRSIWDNFANLRIRDREEKGVEMALENGTMEGNEGRSNKRMRTDENGS